jgi:hypothetical protein
MTCRAVARKPQQPPRRRDGSGVGKAVDDPEPDIHRSAFHHAHPVELQANMAYPQTPPRVVAEQLPVGAESGRPRRIDRAKQSGLTKAPGPCPCPIEAMQHHVPPTRRRSAGRRLRPAGPHPGSCGRRRGKYRFRRGLSGGIAVGEAEQSSHSRPSAHDAEHREHDQNNRDWADDRRRDPPCRRPPAARPRMPGMRAAGYREGHGHQGARKSCYGVRVIHRRLLAGPHQSHGFSAHAKHRRLSWPSVVRLGKDIW